MTDRELMQQALEALNRSDYLGWQLNIPIIKALRERLAQPEQEPVVWMYVNRSKPHMKVEGPLHIVCQCDECKKCLGPVSWGVFDGLNLHDTFFTKEEAQEMVRLKGDGSVVKPLYTSRRIWVGLTDEEMHECWDSPLTPLGMKHARMIEAKLKEKNG